LGICSFRHDGIREAIQAALGLSGAWASDVVHRECPPDGRDHSSRLLYGHGRDGSAEHAHRTLIRWMADFSRLDRPFLVASLSILAPDERRGESTQGRRICAQHSLLELQKKHELVDSGQKV